MICLSSLTPLQSQKLNQNLISVDRDRLKAVMEKAELADACDKTVTGLILENSRLKESLQKKSQDAETYKNELDDISDRYDKTRLILLVIGFAVLLYIVIKIRF